MRHRHHAWVGLAVVALAATLVGATPTAPATITALIGGQVFELELALTPESRERGLMERAELRADRGMLFVFPELAPRRFWMKHTRIDLDIIYLDDAGRVVSTVAMRREKAQAERETDEQYEDRLPLYPSGAPARFAIELPAGSLPLLNLTAGDALDLAVDRLKALAR